MKKSPIIISCLLIILTGLSMTGQNAKPEYSVLNKIPIPGEGGWDYLTVEETGAGKLFISHGTVVQVVDLATGQVAATIKDTPGVHGIALAMDLNKGFISVGRNASVKVFDLKSFVPIADVKVTGENPDAIMYDKFSKKVFVFNGRTANATVIDANTNEVVSTISLDGKPEFAVSDDAGNIYVNIEDKSLISVIDANTMKVTKSWPIAPGKEASGLAIDNETHRLFAVCANKLMIIVDATDGHVVAKLPIGEGSDGVKFDPILKRAYSSNGEGTVTVVQEVDKDNFKVLETLKTNPGARTLALDPRTHHIYTPTQEYNPPAPKTAADPNPKRTPKPNSFYIMDIAPIKK